MKNLNAIVWLYRGETEKYTALMGEYGVAINKAISNLPTVSEKLRSMLETDFANRLLDDMPQGADIDELYPQLEIYAEVVKRTVDSYIKASKTRNKKAIDTETESVISAIREIQTTINAMMWLINRFGTGVYQDVLGLCKLADRAEIAEKGYSLTPGAYVGVAPVEDDGVDFAARMAEIHSELLTLQAESNELMDTISKNMKEMGL